MLFRTTEASFKRYAYTMPNKIELSTTLARRKHGSGFKRQIQFDSLAEIK